MNCHDNMCFACESVIWAGLIGDSFSLLHLASAVAAQRLQSSEGSLTHTSSHWRCWSEHLHIGSPCDLGFPSWFPRASVLKMRARQKLYHLLWPSPRSHATCLSPHSIDRGSCKPQPVTCGGKIRLYVLMERPGSGTRKYLVATFGKYSLPHKDRA